jgi:hypothetical protein
VNIAATVRSAIRAMLLSTLIPAMGCGQPQASLTIDTDERHQTMTGWEVTARGWEFDKDNDRFDGSWVAQREEIAAMLVDEAGIDRLRLEIKSGIENPIDYWALFAAGRIGYKEYKDHFYEKVNDNADPLTLNPAGVQFSDLDWRVENIVLPVKKRLEGRGRRLKLNLAYGDFKWTASKGSLSHAKNPEEYAELVVAAFARLKAKYGLVPDSFEIIIEPDNSDDWSGTAIGRAILATSARLDAAGFRGVDIIAPSTAKAQRALDYLRDIERVPGAAARLTTLSYHRYEDVPDAEELNEIRDTARRGHMRTAMLEYVDGGVADLISDLADGDASAWQKYGIATRDRGDGKTRPGWLIVASGPEGAPPALRLTPVARALAFIFNAVDQGSVRIGAKSSNEDFASVAFLLPGGKLIVAGHALSAMPVAISGLRPGRYRLESVGADGARKSEPANVGKDGKLGISAAQDATYVLTEN